MSKVATPSKVGILDDVSFDGRFDGIQLFLVEDVHGQHGERDQHQNRQRQFQKGALGVNFPFQIVQIDLG